MIGFALHPEAFTDLDELWEFIAADNIEAADRIIGEVFEALRRLAAFPGTSVITDRTLPEGARHRKHAAQEAARGVALGDRGDP